MAPTSSWWRGIEDGLAVAARERLGLLGHLAQWPYDNDVQPAQARGRGGDAEQAGQDGAVLEAVLGDREPGRGLPAHDASSSSDLAAPPPTNGAAPATCTPPPSR